MFILTVTVHGADYKFYLEDCWLAWEYAHYLYKKTKEIDMDVCDSHYKRGYDNTIFNDFKDSVIWIETKLDNAVLYRAKCENIILDDEFLRKKMKRGDMYANR